jgi:acetylornithine deacetylase/succinyl-diaminopimelate desuccinylase-like protein
MTYLEVHVTGPQEDLHSGFYGGAVHKPAVALVQILDQLYAADGTIAVPGFYDAVVELTAAEREMIARTGISEEQLTAVTGVPAQWGDQNFTIKERVSARPTLDINGIWGGYAGPGPKTIIPAAAGAKLSSRLVANQYPQQIFELVRDFVASIAPATVNVEVKLITTGLPALIPMDLPAMQAAARAYQRGWGHTPVFTRGGGSIPVVADFVDLLQVPVVMMGYGLDDDGLHAPNESYSLKMFVRGIETAIVYMEELAQLG